MRAHLVERTVVYPVGDVGEAFAGVWGEAGRATAGDLRPADSCVAGAGVINVPAGLVLQRAGLAG